MDTEEIKSEAGLQLEQVAAMPYNPYLKEEVQKIRQKYSIPKDYEKACDWFYHEHAPGNLKSIFSLFSPGARDPILRSETGEDLYETEVPLEQDVWRLLLQFRLPLYVFRNLLLYILTNDEIWIDIVAFAPKIEFATDFKRGLPDLKVTITRLGAWTTKKQWDELWYRKVEPEVARLRSVYEEMLGAIDLPKKRSTLKSYREQMQRWAEWHQLSKIDGLGPAKALTKWLNDHPDQWDRYDASTVTHATKRFEQIIAPAFMIKP